MTSTQEARELLAACPFCGGAATCAQDKYLVWLGGCSNLKCAFNPSITSESRADLVRIWNTRALSARPSLPREEVARAAFEADCLYHGHLLNWGRVHEHAPRGYATEVLNWQAVAGAILALGGEGESEPSAYLKTWWDDVDPELSAVPSGHRCRVDLSEVCEPWLAARKPTITPLYARSPPPAAQGNG